MKKYDLSGEWLLWLDEEKSGSFEGGELSHAFDDVITLPATTAQAGKASHGENTARETYFLTERYPFYGCAWYQRTVRIQEEDVGRPIYLYFERTRMTRVWVNGVLIGSNDSICAPHRYEISSAVKEQELTITVCVNNADYPTKGGHMTSQDTQTNWNGILGKMELQVFAPVDVLFAVTESDSRTGEIRVTLELYNAWMMPEEREILVNGEYVFLPEEILPTSGLQTAPLYLIENSHRQTITLQPGLSRQTITVKVANVMCFGEFTPCFGQLHIRCVEKEGDVLRPVFSKAQESVLERVEEKLGSAAGRNAAAGALTVDAVFGFREFAASRHHFYINGIKTFLRGKHDGMIFPLTGAAPMDVEGWLKVMRTAKRFGINHYRFHTCCPPEAAFFAADLLGIYMEPELPFWGTIAAPGEEGYNKEEQDYLIAEGFRLMEAYGSHPSFVMMSLGNELWGSRERLGEIIEGFRAVDKRHLYTSGSNNFQFYPSDIPQEDFFAGVRFDRDSLIRGSYAMCDAPQGFVQTEQPNTVHSYDVFFDEEEEAEELEIGRTPGDSKNAGSLQNGKNPGKNGISENAAEREIEIQYGTGVKKVKTSSAKAFTTNKPIVSHEVGQYCTYPDFKEISHYTGVLAARNLEVFRERLAAAGMAEQGEEFFRNSGALAAFCYKMELEAAHRSKMLAGYQLLDIQDFSGQGTALVGVLNALMEEKGMISGREWRGFCAPTVALVCLPKFVYAQGETVKGGLTISHYGAQMLRGAVLNVMVTEVQKPQKGGARTKFLLDADYPQKALANGVHSVGEFALELPVTDAFAEYLLTLTLTGQDEELINRNTYALYSYPKREGLHVFAQSVQKSGTAALLLCEDCGKHDVSGKAGQPNLANNASKSAGISDVAGAAPEKTEPLYVTNNASEAKTLLGRGGRVLFLPEEIKEKVQGTFCTDFWCYPMFRAISESVNRPVPVGTLGLNIKENHAALRSFGSHTFSTPQWYDIVTESDAAVLDKTALHPIVQTIDNFERNHKLGTVFEAKCMGGSLLACTSRLQHMQDSVAAQNLYESLVNYAASAEFVPSEELTEEEFERIFG